MVPNYPQISPKSNADACNSYIVLPTAMLACRHQQKYNHNVNAHKTIPKTGKMQTPLR